MRFWNPGRVLECRLPSRRLSTSCASGMSHVGLANMTACSNSVVLCLADARCSSCRWKSVVEWPWRSFRLSLYYTSNGLCSKRLAAARSWWRISNTLLIWKSAKVRGGCSVCGICWYKDGWVVYDIIIFTFPPKLFFQGSWTLPTPTKRLALRASEEWARCQIFLFIYIASAYSTALDRDYHHSHWFLSSQGLTM